MKSVIHIEICKSCWKPNSWNIRIGDIQGSGESSNISEQDMISEIVDAVVELRDTPLTKCLVCGKDKGYHEYKNSECKEFTSSTQDTKEGGLAK